MIVLRHFLRKDLFPIPLNFFLVALCIDNTVKAHPITAEAVMKVFGTVTGAMFYTILFYYIRQRLGTFMTEPYGFLCALIACYWFMRGLKSEKQLSMIIGFLFLSIGLNARPAAMFLFPTLGLWYFFVFLKGHSKRFLWAFCALFVMLLGFGLNRITQIAVYGPGNIPNRQAAEMVYGLCLGGKSWGDVVASPEMTAMGDSDNVIRDVAALCGPILKEHPENILSALRTIFVDSLIQSEYYGAFSYVNGNPQKAQKFVRYTLMALWLAGFCLITIRRNKTCNSFLLAAVIGILLSEFAAVPFTTNYLRLYAVSMWIPAIITGLFLQYLCVNFMRFEFNVFDSHTFEFTESTVIISSGILIFLCACFGAGYIQSHPYQKPIEKSGFCKDGQDVLITSVDKGSYIYLEEQPELKTEHYPHFRLPYVRQYIHNTASVEMFPFTDEINKPTAIIRGINLSDNSDALIFAPLDLVDGKEGYVQFCGAFIEPPILRNDHFFIPTSAVFFEDDL